MVSAPRFWTAALCLAMVCALFVGCATSSDTLSGGGSAAMSLGYAHTPQDDTATDPPHRFLADLSVRGLVRYGGLGYAPGLDLQFGASAPAGLVYRAELHPVGLGLWTEGGVLLAVQAGVGVSGTAPLTAARVPIPITALFGLQATEAWHLALEAGIAWLPWDNIDNTSALLPIADERRVVLRVRKGTSDWSSSWRWGNGYHLGVTLTERAGSVSMGVLVGYSLDGQAL